MKKDKKRALRFLVQKFLACAFSALLILPFSTVFNVSAENELPSRAAAESIRAESTESAAESVRGESTGTAGESAGTAAESTGTAAESAGTAAESADAAAESAGTAAESAGTAAESTGTAAESADAAAESVQTESTEAAAESADAVTAGDDELTGSGTISGAVTSLSEGGIYSIHSAADANLCLDISGASFFSGGNVQLYRSNNTNAQKFSAHQNGDGTWTFTNANSGLVLDVSGNSAKDGANVQQYRGNGSAAQRFNLISHADGSFEIQGSSSKKALDISGGQLENGQNIQLYHENSTAAQAFVFFSATASYSDYSGDYYISSSVDDGRCIDVSGGSSANGANIQLYTSNGTHAQKFTLVSEGSGCYTIRTSFGKYLDVSGGCSLPGTNVQQYSGNGTNAQKWRICGNSDGTVTFISACGENVLDLSGGLAEDGDNIAIWSYNGSGAQRWRLHTNPPEASRSGNSSQETESSTIDLGTWLLTGYCDDEASQGAYIGQTASGGPLTAGVTVAVAPQTMSRLGLNFGDQLLVNGHVYTIWDSGDYGMSVRNGGLCLDIFTNSAAECYASYCNGYAEVYLIR